MRGKPATKRDIKPDVKFGKVEVARFINQVMRRGKKSTAQQLVYNAFDLIQKRTKKDPLEVFIQAIKNVSPVLEVRGRRIGGANYQVPITVRGSRQLNLAFRWIIEAARNRKGKPMSEKLAMEIIDAANKEGAAMKKRENIHKMAEANRAFAHFAR